MEKEKSDVVFVFAGKPLKAQLKLATELTGIPQSVIVRNALETKMRAMARQLPKLRRLRKTQRERSNGGQPEAGV